MHDYEQIKKEIKHNGVCFQAIVNVLECSVCNSDPLQYNEQETNEKTFRHDEAYVFTIGHRERNRPDLLFMCGPKPGEPPFNIQEQMEYIEQVVNLIGSIIKQWDTDPVVLHDDYVDNNGRLYKFVGYLPKGPHEMKDDFTDQTTNYYNSVDYEVLLALPFGWRRDKLSH